MGLAASQGRLLSLTSRNHDLVYEGQQISQQRLMLTQASSLAAEKYTAAMNNTIMQGTVNGKTQLLTYDLITDQNPLTGLCMRLVDAKGNVVVPGESIEVQKTETDEETGETKKVSAGRYTNTADFVTRYMSDLSGDKKTELSAYSLSEIYNYYNENYENKDSSLTVIHRNKANNELVKEGEKIRTDANIYDSAYIQRMLLTGEFKLQQAKPDNSYEDMVWQGSTMISEISDTSDDSAAEAEYEAAAIEFQKKDKILEMRLNQVETQQKAVQTEIDSVKKTVKENIESSFKTFG